VCKEDIFVFVGDSNCLSCCDFLSSAGSVGVDGVFIYDLVFWAVFFGWGLVVLFFLFLVVFFVSLFWFCC
ncbi:hypothetical protein ACQWHW_24750, partial [Salmonella enterica subsp. enterica serovar Infantis]